MWTYTMILSRYKLGRYSNKWEGTEKNEKGKRNIEPNKEADAISELRDEGRGICTVAE